MLTNNLKIVKSHYFQVNPNLELHSFAINELVSRKVHYNQVIYYLHLLYFYIWLHKEGNKKNTNVSISFCRMSLWHLSQAQHSNQSRRWHMKKSVEKSKLCLSWMSIYISKCHKSLNFRSQIHPEPVISFFHKQDWIPFSPSCERSLGSIGNCIAPMFALEGPVERQKAKGKMKVNYLR